MSSIEKIIKFNTQTVGREKLIRLCQYVTKFINALLQTYYRSYADNGAKILDLIYKLRDLEQYFISCRRLINFGRCADQLYSAIKCLQIYDPVHRMTATISKLSSSFQMYADHILWLNQMGFLKIEKQDWIEKANKFWMYSVLVNLSRDFYELICIIHKKRIREENETDFGLHTLTMTTPVKWFREYPRESCDFIKNICDFWIPYSSLRKVNLHPSVIGILGIISTTMGILQAYDKSYRLSSI